MKDNLNIVIFFTACIFALSALAGVNLAKYVHFKLSHYFYRSLLCMGIATCFGIYFIIWLQNKF